VGLGAFAVGLSLEAAIIRAVRGNRSTLEWLSDALISTAVAGITYLWLHLRAARQRETRLAREKIAIDGQLRLAATIQRNLLPEVPQATAGFRWAARMIPAGRIGGDFYDFFEPAAGTVLAILADVSGKGIPAALILSSLKTLFRTFARASADPAVLAERLSAALHEEHAGVPYATAIVARFETSPWRLTYVNAGHPAGYLLRDDAVLALPSCGRPLGLLPGSAYEPVGVRLCPGDLGLLITDGVTEAFDGDPATLHDAVAASRELLSSGVSPARICERLLRAAAAGPGPTGAPDWQDDRTVFVFAVGNPSVGGALDGPRPRQLAPGVVAPRR